jgi:hypothetical protein
MRTTRRVLATCCLALLIAGCRGCQAYRPRVRPPAPHVLDKPAVIAVLDDVKEPGHPPASTGGEDAKARAAHARAKDGAAEPRNPPHMNVEYRFSERGGGVVWTEPDAAGKHRVIYNGRAGPAFGELGNVELSPDGLHYAYSGLVGDEWQLMVDGREGPRYRDLGTLHYSPDGAHLLFDARFGDVMKIVVDGTPRRESPRGFASKDFSADSSKVVYIEPVNDEVGHLVVADLAFQAPRVVEDHALGFTMSNDRSRVAATVAVDGGVRVIAFDSDQPDRVRRGKKYERVAGMDFAPEGYPLGYLALQRGQTLLVVEEDEIPLAKGEQIVGGAAVRWGERGFGALLKSGGSVTFRQYFTAAVPPEGSYEEAFGLVYGAEGRAHVYAARRGSSWFVVANGREGPPWDAVASPSFTPDGRYLVYRARKEGKRFVVVADPEGKTIRELPPYEQVFDVRFTQDGRSIAYGVKDGRELAWKVEPLP